MANEVGQRATDFTLPTDEGKFLSLKALKGKKVILYFYPKDNTPGCIKEACAFRDSWANLERIDATVIGISRDSVNSHQAFKSKYNLPFTLLSDREGNVCEHYGVLVNKSLLGKKYKSIERTTFLINEAGIISAVWRKVKVNGHVTEVLEKLTS